MYVAINTYFYAINCRRVVYACQWYAIGAQTAQTAIHRTIHSIYSRLKII